MNSQQLIERYRDLQRYANWTDADAQTIRELSPSVTPYFPHLVEDFYEEIERHPNALKVITGGKAQIDRLKQTLIAWLTDLFSGTYDEDYVVRRWKIGHRHVEIGLDQIYTNMALSRLRRGLLGLLERTWQGTTSELLRARSSLNTLLDLDLALIQDAYQTEFNQRQQAMERLATVGKVAGGIAHELRNPLNVIKTSVFYLLNARNPDPEKTAKHLSRIERQVGMANDVIVALTSFATMPFPDLRPFEIPAFLSDVLDRHEFADGIDVAVQSTDGLPPALADCDQLCIVLSNLIRNACEAMPQGGKLSLTAEMDGDDVLVNVADTGHGIPPEDLKRIMEPFYSTKARGIGLGLALAKAIVDKNKGNLSVKSDVNRGTTFTIRLNAVQADGVGL
ncbi:MAG TPA: protoglobin domain-containing protein [Planctomycetaceae bacterium]|nr:protoglobin domain-containing protein [Planctomycetaceae bacterium]